MADTDIHYYEPDPERALFQGFIPPLLEKGGLTYQWTANAVKDALEKQNDDIVYTMSGGNKTIFHNVIIGRPAGKEDTMPEHYHYHVRHTVEQNEQNGVAGVYILRQP